MDQSTTHASTLSISRIVGPALMVLILTENPLVNPNLYQNQSPPVVYLNGFVLFVCGLAVVQCHNTWCLAGISKSIVHVAGSSGKNKSRRRHNSLVTSTAVLVTIVGWGMMLLGLSRMIFPEAWAEKSRKMHTLFAGATLQSRIQIYFTRENVALLLWEMILLFVGGFLTYQAYFGSISGMQEVQQQRRQDLKEP